MIEKIGTFVCGMCAVPLLWLMASWADVLINQFGGQPSWWNFFVLFLR